MLAAARATVLFRTKTNTRDCGGCIGKAIERWMQKKTDVNIINNTIQHKTKH